MLSAKSVQDIDIFKKLSVEVITPNFTIKKDLKNKKSEEFKKLEELIEGQKFIKKDYSKWYGLKSFTLNLICDSPIDI